MYASEKGGQSLLESSEPAGRALTKPRRSSEEKPEPFLLLETLNSWDKMRSKRKKKNITKRQKISTYNRLSEVNNIYKDVKLQ